MTELGTIERAYADGYAAARAEIERLTALNAELVAALKLWGHPDCDCEFCFRSRTAIAKVEGK